jgi:glycosyltransferase involved in cell wall biosynthesis
MSTVEQPRLSVVIPAHNNGMLLEATLDSLTRQSMPAGDFEVIVGDDGSPVALTPVVDRYADRLDVHCVRSERNRGRGANRNAAAALARAAILLFLDADTVAHPGLLARHLAYHAGRGGRAGVLLGQRFDIDWVGADAIRRGDPVVPAMLDAERADPRTEDTAMPQRMRDFLRAPWVLGLTHNASVDRESFLKVGGFDEAMVKWGAEDIEFFYRVFQLHAAATDLFELDNEAVSYHLPHFRDGTNGLASMDNIKYVLRKHPYYDIEALYSLRNFGRHLGRIRIYGDAIDACRRHGLGRPSALPAEVRDALAAQSALAIGFGVSALPLGAGSYTFDHGAPLSATNSHLLGTALLQFKTAQLDVIVNVDLWRFFLPDDLWVFLLRGLRKANRVELIATRTEVDQASMLPAPFVADLDYLIEMLRPHFDVTVASLESATRLTIR